MWTGCAETAFPPQVPCLNPQNKAGAPWEEWRTQPLQSRDYLLADAGMQCEEAEVNLGSSIPLHLPDCSSHWTEENDFYYPLKPSM